MMPYSSEHRSSKESERKGAKKSCKTRRFCGGLALLRAPYTNSAFTTELSLIWEGWCDFKRDTKIGEALLSILMQAFVSRRNIDVLALLVGWLLRSLQRLSDPALPPLLPFFRHVVRKVQVQLSHSKYILAHFLRSEEPPANFAEFGKWTNKARLANSPYGDRLVVQRLGR